MLLAANYQPESTKAYCNVELHSHKFSLLFNLPSWKGVCPSAVKTRSIK